MPDYRAQQAIQEGKEAFIEGRTRNPYLYMGATGMALSAWFDKGYQEAKKAKESEKNGI